MRIVSDRDINRGQVIPWYYGYTWRRIDTRDVVLLFIPFNFLVGVLRQWWLRLMQGPRNRLEASIRKAMDDEEGEAWTLGYRDGQKAGWDTVVQGLQLLTGEEFEKVKAFFKRMGSELIR